VAAGRKRAAPKAQAPSLLRRLVGLAGKAALAFVALSLGAVALLRVVDPPTTAFMLEREAEARDKGERLVLKHQWVPLERISKNLQLAVISAEDQNFPTHHGFDVKAIEDAMEEHLEGRSSRGASTLTQQVAKNLFLWGGHSFVRKGLEAWFTVLIEVCWPKRRILEVHLNVAEFGNGVYGAEAAARVNFNKSAAALTMEEAALMAVVLPAPRHRKVTQPSASSRQRADWVLEQAQHLTFSVLP
jgi:monofunctional biosynthetic peptidoglycan transglycosylase